MDALEALGNEIRISILRELADAERALSFTELRDRVGLRDSGKFNYHLSTLCEYFVRDTNEGYELGHAGTRVISATGRPAPDEAEDSGVEPIAAEEECPVCGEPNCEKLFHVHLSAPWR
ncbi:hypothetical protein L593_00520 [Salinarchaeum sp. Harcht-Bsk1]|nr:hypothetical protein L593_00520 [Salinarchaeum sp. Harcht-Bsk1]